MKGLSLIQNTNAALSTITIYSILRAFVGLPCRGGQI